MEDFIKNHKTGLAVVGSSLNEVKNEMIQYISTLQKKAADAEKVRVELDELRQTVVDLRAKHENSEKIRKMLQTQLEQQVEKNNRYEYGWYEAELRKALEDVEVHKAKIKHAEENIVNELNAGKVAEMTPKELEQFEMDIDRLETKLAEETQECARYSEKYSQLRDFVFDLKEQLSELLKINRSSDLEMCHHNLVVDNSGIPNTPQKQLELLANIIAQKVIELRVEENTVEMAEASRRRMPMSPTSSVTTPTHFSVTPRTGLQHNNEEIDATTVTGPTQTSVDQGPPTKIGEQQQRMSFDSREPAPVIAEDFAPLTLSQIKIEQPSLSQVDSHMSHIDLTYENNPVESLPMSVSAVSPEKNVPIARKSDGGRLLFSGSTQKESSRDPIVAAPRGPQEITSVPSEVPLLVITLPPNSLPENLSKDSVQIKTEPREETDTTTAVIPLRNKHGVDRTKKARGRHVCKCGQIFCLERGLKRHIDYFMGEQHFGCSKCARHFKYTSDLRAHMKNIHKMNYTLSGCSQCGALFSTKKDLRTHQAQLNHRRKRKTITKVDLTFSAPSPSGNNPATENAQGDTHKIFDNQHMKSRRGRKTTHEVNLTLPAPSPPGKNCKVPESGRFPCTLCSRCFLFPSWLKSHMKAKHKMLGIELIKSTTSNARNPMLPSITIPTTHGIPTHPPTAVSSSSFTSQSKTTKESTSSKVVAGSSRQCLTPFISTAVQNSNENDLIIDMHLTEEPNPHVNKHGIDMARAGFFCLCGHEFHGLLNLKSHVRYYSVKRRFVCKTCKKGFLIPSLFRQHMLQWHNTVYNTKNWCKSCGKKFPTYIQLYHHFWNVHNPNDTSMELPEVKYTPSEIPSSNAVPLVPDSVNPMA